MTQHSSQPNTVCPPLACEEIINLYLRDIDRTLIRENLKLTPAQRAEKFMGVIRFLEATRGIAQTAPRHDARH